MKLDKRTGHGPIKVVGLGNVLMQDDGFGPTVVHTLEAQWRCDPEVAFEDLGTPGFDLVAHLGEAAALIVVDSVHDEGGAGALHLWRRPALLRRRFEPRVQAHDPGLIEALVTLELAGRAPAEVLLVGVVPKCTAPGTVLTAPVQHAVPRACEAILQELRRWGIRTVRRTPAPAPDLWWETVPCTS